MAILCKHLREENRHWAKILFFVLWWHNWSKFHRNYCKNMFVVMLCKERCPFYRTSQSTLSPFDNIRCHSKRPLFDVVLILYIENAITSIQIIFFFPLTNSKKKSSRKYETFFRKKDYINDFDWVGLQIRIFCAGIWRDFLAVPLKRVIPLFRRQNKCWSRFCPLCCLFNVLWNSRDT